MTSQMPPQNWLTLKQHFKLAKHGPPVSAKDLTKQADRSGLPIHQVLFMWLTTKVCLSQLTPQTDKSGGKSKPICHLQAVPGFPATCCSWVRKMERFSHSMRQRAPSYGLPRSPRKCLQHQRNLMALS